MKRKYRKKINTGLVLLLLFSLVTGCSDMENRLDNEFYAHKEAEINSNQKDHYERSTTLTVDTSGCLSIERNIRELTQPMGEKGTWTIFIYLCGTDLESEDGSASLDIQEMCAGNPAEKINVILQTGGSDFWMEKKISSRKSQRFQVTDGKLRLIAEGKKTNMGNKDTLYDFLSWGVENYPAEKMGVVFWNHGSGSINGVCFDEQYDDDSLSLMEIDDAFTRVYREMTSPFEFIGFDACLMATAETANLLAPHARYLIASEELESGYGWNYTSLIEYLNKNPEADGISLGKNICDNYYEGCKKSDEEEDATLAVIDLSCMNDILQSFDITSSVINAHCSDSEFLASITRGFTSAKKFGGNNRFEGYTNMVDLGDMLTNISDSIPEAKNTLDILERAVVYQVKGSNCEKANGLSIYYPLQVEGSDELSILKNICISPYYMNFVELVAYGAQTGNLKQYSGNEWLDSDSGFWDFEHEYSGWDEYFEKNEGGRIESTSMIELSVRPFMNENGYYTMTIDQNSLDYVSGVYFTLYVDSGDGETYYYLGYDNDVYFDLDTGVVEDDFYGVWPCLPDGQVVTLELVEEGVDYNIYTTPVLFNGNEMNLRIRKSWIDYNAGEAEYTILGAWEGIDSDTGEAGRNMIKVKAGDTIVPLYYFYEWDSDDEFLVEGEKYTVDENFLIEDYFLYEGDYYYAFEIMDIFNSSLYTDFEEFYVDENSDIYYYE